MRRVGALTRAVLTLAALSLVEAAAGAGVLEVTPILSDVVTTADGATSLTLRNRATTPSTVQLRLMRWRVTDGVERLEPATGIGVSPPFATIGPGATHVVRIVRVSRAPVVGEEAYRLLLDELPAPGGVAGSVTLTVRHELPVFFRNPAARPAQVRWTLGAVDGARVLIATNDGERRLRVSGLRLVDANGAAVEFGAGLAGYVLGGQQRRWSLPAGKALSGRVTVEFASEAGAATAPVELTGRPGA